MLVEVLRCYTMESDDSSNTIAWPSNRKINPWRFYFFFNEIRELASSINVIFHQELRSTNSFTDTLAKHGVVRVSLLGDFHDVSKEEVGFNALVPSFVTFPSVSFFFINKSFCYQF